MPESGESNVVKFPDTHIETQRAYDLGITIPVNSYSPDYLFFTGASEKGYVKFVPEIKDTASNEVNMLKVVAETEEVGHLIQASKKFFDLTDIAQLFRFSYEGSPEKIQYYLNTGPIEQPKKSRFDFRHPSLRKRPDLNKQYQDLLDANNGELLNRLLSTAHKNKSKSNDRSETVVALHTKTHEEQYKPYSEREMEKFTSALFMPVWLKIQDSKETIKRIPAKY